LPKREEDNGDAPLKKEERFAARDREFPLGLIRVFEAEDFVRHRASPPLISAIGLLPSASNLKLNVD
jgi:hypothetical protein